MYIFTWKRVREMFKFVRFKKKKGRQHAEQKSSSKEITRIVKVPNMRKCGLGTLKHSYIAFSSLDFVRR